MAQSSGAEAVSLAKPDIAHVGYHRTATNYLQRCVFPALAEWVFMPRSTGARYFDRQAGFDETGVRAFYAEEQKANRDDKPFLVSYEGFTGTDERDDFGPTEDLKRLNPDLRILLVLRSQHEIFPSLYHLHVKGGGRLDYPAFVARAIAGGKCDYRAMVEHLDGLFGAERVKVLLYEDIARAPDGFMAALCGFLGAPAMALPKAARRVNSRESDSVLRLRLLTNRTDTGPIARQLQAVGMKAAQRLDRLTERLGGRPLAALDLDGARQAIDAAFAPGNRALATRLGRSLTDYGYPT